MQVPAITVPENISESVLYFPANVCGLVIGELFIPDTVVAIINIPEITVPDFAECPFYVVLPPPIYYASSAYPLYEIDACTVSSTLINAEFVREPINWLTDYSEGITIGSDLQSGNLRDVHLFLEPVIDGLVLQTSLLNVNLRDAPKISIPPEGITLNTNFISGTMRVFRYLSTEVSADSINITSNLISGSVAGFRYLNTSTNDSIFIGSTVLSGSTHNYRYLALPEVQVDSIALTSNLISGNLV